MVRGQPQPAQVEAYAMGAVEPKRTHGRNRISQRASTIRTPHSCVEGTRRTQDHPQALGQVFDVLIDSAGALNLGLVGDIEPTL